MRTYSILVLGSLLSCAEQSDPLHLPPVGSDSPKNVIYILTDDHRFDFMGFTGKVPWLQTSNLDSIAGKAFQARHLCEVPPIMGTSACRIG